MSLKNKINKILRKFNVELHGTGYLKSLTKGELNANEMDVFKKVFDGGDIVIYDVGANRGSMINNFLVEFPDAQIHAFEPYYPLYEELVRQFGFNKKIVINKHGIYNCETELLFNINKSVDTSSFLNSKKTGLNSDPQVKTVHQEQVPVTTLDKYAEKCGHQKINILKLDIQGGEMKALDGAVELLTNQRIDMIFCETYFVQQYEDQPLFFEIAGLLMKYGYVLQDLYHPIYGKGKIAWCDSMFIRKDLKLN